MPTIASEQPCKDIVFFPFVYIEINGVWDYLTLLWRMSMGLTVLDFYAKLDVGIPLLQPEQRNTPDTARAHPPLVLVANND